MRVVYLTSLPKTKKPDWGTLSKRVVPGSIALPDGVQGEPAVVRSFGDYVGASASSRVGLILIGEPEPGGYTRLQLVHELVETRNLDDQKFNWLWGLSNPAELAMYSHLFGPYVNSVIRLAFCETAYLYAAYGARFSREHGVLGYIRRNGSVRELNREQMRTFHYNESIVSDFVNGQYPQAYAEKGRDILELEEDI